MKKGIFRKANRINIKVKEQAQLELLAIARKTHSLVKQVKHKCKGLHKDVEPGLFPLSW